MRIVTLLTSRMLLPLLHHPLSDRIILNDAFPSFADRFDHLCIFVGFIPVERLLDVFLCWRSKTNNLAPARSRVCYEMRDIRDAFDVRLLCKSGQSTREKFTLDFTGKISTGSVNLFSLVNQVPLLDRSDLIN